MGAQTTIKAKRNLRMEGSSKICFTKGEYYFGDTKPRIEDMTVIDNQGEPHRIGVWRNNFVKVS